MVSVNWIIENLVNEPSFRQLALAVENASYPLQQIRGDFLKADLKNYEAQPVLFNGSIEMCKIAKEVLAPRGNYPVLYCDWDKYKCSSYYPALDKFLFNDERIMVPVGEFLRQPFFFYRTVGKESLIFARPDSGEKEFKGGLVDLQDIKSFSEQFAHMKDELMILSSPKTIIGEWRYVVAPPNEIITYSCYRYQGQRTLVNSVPPKATTFVREVMAIGYHPDKVYCIDVCEDSDGKYWLLELTSFSSAGLYACDKDKIVSRVSEIALQDFNDRVVAGYE